MNRILLDCERTKYRHTGLFQFCLELGTALIDVVDRNLEDITFYVPEKEQNLFGTAQNYMLQHHLHKFYMPHQSRFNLWHSTYQDSNYFPASNRLKKLVTIHDLNFLVAYQQEPKKLKKFTDKIQRNIDRAQHIVCISEYTKNIFLQHIETGGKPVDVIYNGCNIISGTAAHEPFRRPAKPFIFSIGRIVPLKNIHVLPCLLVGNDFELVIAGEAEETYLRKVQEEAKLHGVENRVIVTGAISEADKAWYYKNCLAFVFPSLAEGFGFPLVEAMYYGKPVFISGTSSLPEIAGGLASIFEHFDCAYMQQVFANGLKHFSTHDMGERLHQRAIAFNWQHTATEYLSIYRKILQDD